MMWYYHAVVLHNSVTQNQLNETSKFLVSDVMIDNWTLFAALIMNYITSYYGCYFKIVCLIVQSIKKKAPNILSLLLLFFYIYILFMDFLFNREVRVVYIFTLILIIAISGTNFLQD